MDILDPEKKPYENDIMSASLKRLLDDSDERESEQQFAKRMALQAMSLRNFHAHSKREEALPNQITKRRSALIILITSLVAGGLAISALLHRLKKILKPPQIFLLNENKLTKSSPIPSTNPLPHLDH